MSHPIPYIDRKQMVEVDRLMIEEYGISLYQMMEHAGENLARLIRKEMHVQSDPHIVILVGNGNNGGGGLVCGRFLSNWGYRVQILTVGSADKRKAAPTRHLQTLKLLGVDMMSVNISDLNSIVDSADLVVDAMIGYGLSGNLSKEVTGIINLLNASDKLPVIALDAPSGLDVDSGQQQAVVQAQATLTLALPKKGLASIENNRYVGKLFLADIGVPPQLYAHLGLDVGAVFATESVLQETTRGHFEPVSF